MLTIVGLGPGNPDALPARTRALLQSPLPVFLRTARHPTLEQMSVPNAVSFDDEYQNNPTFEDTYRAIVTRLLRAHETGGDLAYAVPGHPLVGETTVALLLEEAKAQQIPFRIWGAPSFVDAVLEAVGAAVVRDLHLIDALSLAPGAPIAPPELRVGGGPLLLYQVHNRLAASQAKIALMAAGYPDEFTVTIVRAAGTDTESLQLCPLYALDRNPPYDHLTTVWVPDLPAENRRPGYEQLVAIMARLRRKPDGCPWDLKQTHQSLRRYLLEEAYEAAEAIDRDDPDHLCEELGDVLLQVVFHAQLAAEEGVFDQADVCAGIAEKMIRRHPHIFGDGTVNVADADEVLRNWNAIKAGEKKSSAPRSLLDGIPTSLPALMQAMETSQRTVKAGFEWESLEAVWEKVDEEMVELRGEIAQGGSSERVSDEFGDLLFTLVNVARWLKIDPEQALRNQIARFMTRFRYIEAKAAAGDRTVDKLTTEEMNIYWQEAKEIEGMTTKKES